MHFFKLFDEVEENEIKSEDVIKLFKKKHPGEEYDMIFGSESDYDTGRQVRWLQ